MMDRDRPRWAPSTSPERQDDPPTIDASTRHRGWLPWHLRNLRVQSLWERGRGAGVSIAVIDSGVAAPDGIFGNATLYLDENGDAIGPRDDDGHGTACASLIGSQDKLAPGVAPDARIVSIRAARSEGCLNAQAIEAALDTAVRVGCRVISCSFIVPDAPASLLNRVREAADQGVVIVAASGNSSDMRSPFPETAEGLIVVGATTASGEPILDQRLGAFTDVFAPGEDLRAVTCDGSISTCFGETSGATALVAGIIALVLSAFPGKDPVALGRAIERLVKESSDIAPLTGVRGLEEARFLAPLRLLALAEAVA